MNRDNFIAKSKTGLTLTKTKMKIVLFTLIIRKRFVFSLRWS